MSIPRGEYPRPQFARADWLCLNGQWQFEIDNGDTGLERGLKDKANLDGEITVPFCPESPLSGIGNEDFMKAVWYRREVKIPKDWAGRKVLLHFQAVDYDATVWVNGQEVGRHRGGWTPFTCDLSGVAEPGGKATIVLRARDDTRGNQPGGKQSDQFHRGGCMYTRTTGIWQTVWLEPVGELHLRRARITPDVANSRFTVTQPISNNTPGLVLRAAAAFDGKTVAQAQVPADQDFSPTLDLAIPERDVKLWGPGEGNLYDITLELVADGKVVDKVDSYAGLRSVTIDGVAVKINGKSVFQRQVLDQGYYLDGILTAPSDEALKADIELSIAAGFNAARLHQKVFEERFLYHADKLGYLVWGEFGDWGIDHNTPPVSQVAQWLEELQRDYSHPCIIGWCGLNETAQAITDRITPLNDLTRALYLAAKAMDPTRPVLDASGYSHFVPECEIYDSHDYEQDPKTLAGKHAGLSDGKPFTNGQESGRPISLPYRGQPYFVSEFGGIWWNPKAAEGEDSWGYGNRPQSIEQFYERFEGLCSVLLDDPKMFGYCYTQLTDVWQEQNGIYFFDRSEKFDMGRIRAIQTRQAAIEQAT